MQFKCIFTSQPSVTEVIGKLQGADNQLSTELSKSATHNIWLLIYKALTSLQPAKTAEKKSLLPAKTKTNIPADDIQLFFFVLVTKFMTICHC